jgi:tRNA U38,U39,U40 pseudouridine synthase TruA
MIKHELLREQGILVLRPEGALRAEDFTALAAAVDPYIEQHGELKGLMVEAKAFPGWEDFAALLSHLRFVRDHHRRVRRIAVVSDSTLLSVAPRFANHFVSAQVRSFDFSARAAALAWIESAAE